MSFLYILKLCVYYVMVKGKTGWGSSGRFELSPKIMHRLLGGHEELAEVMDDLSGQTDVRSGEGAMGRLLPFYYIHRLIVIWVIEWH